MTTKNELTMKATASDLKNLFAAKIILGSWVLYYTERTNVHSKGRGVYTVRPVDVERMAEGESFTRLSDAKAYLKEMAANEQAAVIRRTIVIEVKSPDFTFSGLTLSDFCDQIAAHLNEDDTLTDGILTFPDPKFVGSWKLK